MRTLTSQRQPDTDAFGGSGRRVRSTARFFGGGASLPLQKEVAQLCRLRKIIQPAFMIVLPKEHPMDYRQLGRTDLNVSAICLGTMTWGEQNSEAEAFAQIERAKEARDQFHRHRRDVPGAAESRNLRHHRTLHRQLLQKSRRPRRLDPRQQDRRPGQHHRLHPRQKPAA